MFSAGVVGKADDVLRTDIANEKLVFDPIIIFPILIFSPSEYIDWFVYIIYKN